MENKEKEEEKSNLQRESKTKQKTSGETVIQIVGSFRRYSEVETVQ